MKIWSLLFIFIAPLTFSQTRVYSFMNSRAEVYSYPCEDSLTQRVLNPFDDVFVTEVDNNFYKIEGLVSSQSKIVG